MVLLIPTMVLSLLLLMTVKANVGQWPLFQRDMTSMMTMLAVAYDDVDADAYHGAADTDDGAVAAPPDDG